MSRARLHCILRNVHMAVGVAIGSYLAPQTSVTGLCGIALVFIVMGFVWPVTEEEVP